MKSGTGCYAQDDTFFSYANGEGVLSFSRLRSGDIVVETTEFLEGEETDASELIVARQVIDSDAFLALIAWGQGKA